MNVKNEIPEEVVCREGEVPAVFDAAAPDLTIGWRGAVHNACCLMRQPLEQQNFIIKEEMLKSAALGTRVLYGKYRSQSESPAQGMSWILGAKIVKKRGCA